MENQLTEEEPQKIEQPAENLANEVAQVFSLIRAYRTKRNIALNNSQGSRVETITKVITVLVVLAIGAILLGLNLLPQSTWGGSDEEIRRTLQLMVLLVYALGGITFLLQYISLKSFLGNFTGGLIDNAEGVIKDDVALMTELDSLSTESINLVIKQFEQMANQLGAFRSFLLGAIEKVGIIPGLIATVVAINKIPSTGSLSWVEGLSFVLLGVYAAMFPLASAAFKLRNLSSVLNHYLAQIRNK